MKWVYNPYDKDFILYWNGKKYKLDAKDYTPLSEDVLDGLFPSDRIIEPLLPADFERKMLALRSLLEIYLNRWKGQIEINLNGSIIEQNDKILEFFSNFQILNEKPKRKGSKEEKVEKAE